MSSADLPELLLTVASEKREMLNLTRKIRLSLDSVRSRIRQSAPFHPSKHVQEDTPDDATGEIVFKGHAVQTILCDGESAQLVNVPTGQGRHEEPEMLAICLVSYPGLHL